MKEDHVFIQRGLLSKQTTRITYHNISDVHIKQSALQRIFGIGDIEIGVPGSNIHQSVKQSFTGKGDVKIKGLGNIQQRGISLEKIQKVRTIEKQLLSKTSSMRKH